MERCVKLHFIHLSDLVALQDFIVYKRYAIVPQGRYPLKFVSIQKYGRAEIYFSRNISNTLIIPRRCFSPASSYFFTENFSTLEDNRLGN